MKNLILCFLGTASAQITCDATNMPLPYFMGRETGGSHDVEAKNLCLSANSQYLAVVGKSQIDVATDTQQEAFLTVYDTAAAMAVQAMVFMKDAGSVESQFNHEFLACTGDPSANSQWAVASQQPLMFSKIDHTNGAAASALKIEGYSTLTLGTQPLVIDSSGNLLILADEVSTGYAYIIKASFTPGFTATFLKVGHVGFSFSCVAVIHQANQDAVLLNMFAGTNKLGVAYLSADLTVNSFKLANATPSSDYRATMMSE